MKILKIFFTIFLLGFLLFGFLYIKSWIQYKADRAEWEDTYKIPAIMALIHSEVSEALEAFRTNDHENFMEEMADVVIRVLDCVGCFPDGFDAVVEAKMEKNRKRGYRHGGKRV